MTKFELQKKEVKTQLQIFNGEVRNFVQNKILIYIYA